MLLSGQRCRIFHPEYGIPRRFRRGSIRGAWASFPAHQAGPTFCNNDLLNATVANPRGNVEKEVLEIVVDVLCDVKRVISEAVDYDLSG